MASRAKTAAGPILACEILPDRVLAARVAPLGSHIEVHTARQLPAGAVAPSLVNPNIADSNAVSSAITDALAGVGGGRSRDVIAIVPDAAVRIVLLDFDALPESRGEAAGMIRFRLKKSLPFDVEKAVISFHARNSGANVKVVASVALASIIHEYEDVFVRAGYAPGVVLPSTLAALGTVDAARPTLVLKVAEQTVTVAIVDQHELRLFRTLDFASSAAGPTRLIEEVYPSLVFFEDQFGSHVERVLVAGQSSARELAPVLGSHTRAPIEDLVAARHVSGGLSGVNHSGPLAGVVGALLA